MTNQLTNYTVTSYLREVVPSHNNNASTLEAPKVIYAPISI